MQNVLIIFWAIVFVATLIVELSTAALVSVWFSAGACVAFAFALFQTPFWLQVLAFSVVSLMLFIILRKKLQHYLTWNRQNTNPYAGHQAMVTSAITGSKPGRVLFEGKDWRAAGLNGESFTQGEIVTIVMLKGATLYVVHYQPSQEIRY